MRTSFDGFFAEPPIRLEAIPADYDHHHILVEDVDGRTWIVGTFPSWIEAYIALTSTPLMNVYRMEDSSKGCSCVHDEPFNEVGSVCTDSAQFGVPVARGRKFLNGPVKYKGL